ncbi:unnamed protein product, partial [Linum tenue]
PEFSQTSFQTTKVPVVFSIGGSVRRWGNDNSGSVVRRWGIGGVVFSICYFRYWGNCIIVLCSYWIFIVVHVRLICSSPFLLLAAIKRN